MRVPIAACVFAIILFGAPRPSVAQNFRPLAPVYGAILQADGPTALRLLAAIDPATLDDQASKAHGCMLERLDPTASPPTPSADAPFSSQALQAYRLYWREAVNRPDDRPAAEARLNSRLADLLNEHSAADVQTLAADRIRSEGRYALGGQTGRLLELMLWSRQDEREFTVALPESSYTIDVFLLDDFESRGWSNWMTCGRTGTGGWTKPEGLYAITPAYPSLDDENFAVNFLAHETQHFADNAAWTGMPGWQLEYRAKLTELALARETLPRVLSGFAVNQGDDPSEPHSYANRRVLAAMRSRLDLSADGDVGKIAPAALRAAALAELFADTARRPTPLSR